MRRVFCCSLLILLIAVGSSVLADSQTLPNLTGNWSGTSIGYDSEGGYDGPPSWEFLVSITEQRGRVFNGTITFTNVIDPQNNDKVDISGVISPDMKTVYLVEYKEGMIIGQIIDKDHMEFIYLESGEGGSSAIDTLTRVKET